MIENYKELRKYGILGENIHRTEYERRFMAENTFVTDFLIGGSPAFFTICPEVASLLEDIRGLDREIRACGVTENVLNGHGRDILADEIIMTNRISGIRCTREEALQAIFEFGFAPRFGCLAERYYRTADGSGMVPPETCTELRGLYDTYVLMEVLEVNPNGMPDGVLFRKGRSDVRDARGNVLHEGMTPEDRITGSMQTALDFLNGDAADALCRAVIFHFMFGYVHPFSDGNGRFGRLLLSATLAEAISPLAACRMTTAIGTGIKAYNAAFKECEDPMNMGDLTPFLITMLKLVRSAVGMEAQALKNLAA